MILYLVRHAWAEEYGDPRWPDDARRPLTEKGKRRFSDVVELLTERGFMPQLVASSPYTRCQETADIIATLAQSHPEVIPVDALAPGGKLSSLLEWTSARAAQFDQIAWIGHAPDVGRLAAGLVGTEATNIHLSKGAVAAIEFDQTPAAGKGELCWLATAKILGC